MFRKLVSLSIATVVAGGLMVATPAVAAAAVSNGVACTKSGATSKNSMGTYKCSTNPLSTSKKLTWLLLDCLKSATAAVKAEKDAVITNANFKAQVPVIELGITTEQANLVEITTKLADTNIRLAAAQAKLAAATAAENKKVLTSAVASWTAAARSYGIKMRSIELTIKKLEAAKKLAVSKPAELARNVADQKNTAKLLCAKGF